MGQSSSVTGREAVHRCHTFSLFQSLFFSFFEFVYFERERENVSACRQERSGERGSQAGSAPSAPSPGIVTRAEIGSRMLHWLSPPGALGAFLKWAVCLCCWGRRALRTSRRPTPYPVGGCLPFRRSSSHFLVRVLGGAKGFNSSPFFPCCSCPYFPIHIGATADQVHLRPPPAVSGCVCLYPT